MSKVEDKAVELMDKAEGAVEQFAGKLEALALQHGGDAWDLALMVARVDAGQTLLWGTIGLFVAIFAAPYSVRQFTLSREITKAHDERYGRDEEIGAFFRGLASGALSAFAGLISLFNFFNTWAWAGIVKPELWLAKQLLNI